jgi:hypothetical protein
VSVDDWFLTAAERGNEATRLRPWTEGNGAEPLLHGSEYFPRLARALAAAGDGDGDGDLMLFADWRGDPDQLLTDDGVTVGGALAAASLRGELVKGLVWRSHLDRLASPPRRTATSRATSATTARRCCSTSGSARWAATTRSPW